MIGGLVLHDGHPALATHLARVDVNEGISMRSHGLSATTIADAIAELRLMALGCRTSKPLIHAWASPSTTYSDADWDMHREAFEVEFGLVGFPCLEVFHLKFGEGGRTASHVHRVYLRIDLNGRASSTSHSAARQEKVSRVAEFTAGERFTSGVFNKSIIARLREEGRPEIADAMVRAGLDKTIAAAASTSAERAMAERLEDLAVDEVWRRCAAAWRRSDSGAAFAAALAESGLRLAQGEKSPVVVTQAGAVYPLLRAINKGGERQNGQAIRTADLAARLKSTVLPAALELPPIVGFEAGVFAVANLDRLPVPGVVRPALLADQDAAAPDACHRTPDLTLEQQAALAELENALHSAAALRAREIRQQIETEIVEEVRRRRQHDVLRLRIETEAATWALPGIGIPDWRDRYRAELAGLPAQYGPHLKWVDRLDAEQRQVTLKSGATLTLAPDRAWSAQSASIDVIPVMIAHAQERGWSSITITGEPEWREQMAQAATRAGLAVAGDDLQGVVSAERLHMHQEALVVSWWHCRADLGRSSPETLHAALDNFLRVLEQIARDETELVHRIIDVNQQKSLAADLGRYQRIKRASAEGVASEAAGHPHPGFARR